MKTRDELLQTVTDLGTITDEAERRARLTALSDDLRELYDSHDTLTASNTQLEGDNKKLQEYNMQLFLRVGNPDKGKPNPEPGPGKEGEGLKYENLFDDKGELK